MNTNVLPSAGLFTVHKQFSKSSEQWVLHHACTCNIFHLCLCSLLLLTCWVQYAKFSFYFGTPRSDKPVNSLYVWPGLVVMCLLQKSHWQLFCSDILHNAATYTYVTLSRICWSFWSSWKHSGVHIGLSLPNTSTPS